MEPRAKHPEPKSYSLLVLDLWSQLARHNLAVSAGKGIGVWEARLFDVERLRNEG